MKIEDKTMSLFHLAMADIKKRELESRKEGDTRYADGLNAAWCILTCTLTDYVESKAKRNPIWRWLVQWRFNKSRKAIRRIKL